MSSVISSGLVVGSAQSTLRSSQRDSELAITRLSSGKRITSAMDDAAGVSASSVLHATVMGLNRAIKNIMEFDALLTTADGALQQVLPILQRTRELAVQAANGTLTDLDRTGLNLEAQGLLDEINQIAKQTQWNNQNLLDGTFKDKYIHVGAQANQAIKVTLPGTGIGDIFPFNYTFTNGDFSNTTAVPTNGRVSLDGWTIDLQQVKLGPGETSTIAGWPAATDNSPAPAPTKNGDDNQPVVGSTRFTYNLAGDVQLESSMTTDEGYDVVHGPVLYSNDAVFMNEGTEVSFRWKAQNGSDNYDVYAYLLNVDNGSTIELLNETGTTTDWRNVKLSNIPTGNYKFVFVSGTFDASGGMAAGASLYVDDVKVSKPSGSSIPPSQILSLNDSKSSQEAITKVDVAMENILQTLAYIGSNKSRLNYVVENITRFSLETQRSLSQIVDTDYAAEQSALSKNKVVSQSASAILGKAQEQFSDIVTFIEGNLIKN